MNWFEFFVVMKCLVGGKNKISEMAESLGFGVWFEGIFCLN